jgi:hypothetical protein
VTGHQIEDEKAEKACSENTNYPERAEDYMTCVVRQENRFGGIQSSKPCAYFI